MKTMTKVLVLATITLMSASSFAATNVGEQKSTDCPTVANNSGPKATENQTGTTAPAPAAAASGAAAK